MPIPRRHSIRESRSAVSNALSEPPHNPDPTKRLMRRLCCAQSIAAIVSSTYRPPWMVTYMSASARSEISPSESPRP